MSQLIPGNSKFAREVCAALGLTHCRAVEIRIAVDEPVTVKAETLMTTDLGSCFIDVIRKYEVIERPDEATTLDSDAREFKPR
jgi:hypothetical protein